MAGYKLVITSENIVRTHEKACKWATVYRSVVGYGVIEIVTDFENTKRGLEIIMAHNGAPDTNDFEHRQIEAVIILKLTISKIQVKGLEMRKVIR